MSEHRPHVGVELVVAIAEVDVGHAGDPQRRPNGQRDARLAAEVNGAPLDEPERLLSPHRRLQPLHVGDAIMALFQDAAAAVAAAIGDLQALAVLTRSRHGLEAVRTGIGLSTGELMLGTIGSASRLKCGVIGDAVNTAARTESMTKQYGAALLITGATRHALKGTYVLRLIDDVIPVGKVEPTEIWEVLDGCSDAERSIKTRHQAHFDAARVHWRRGDLADTLTELAACDDGDRRAVPGALPGTPTQRTAARLAGHHAAPPQVAR